MPEPFESRRPAATGVVAQIAIQIVTQLTAELVHSGLESIRQPSLTRPRHPSILRGQRNQGQPEPPTSHRTRP